MDEATRSFVRQRAGEQCEYCKIPDAVYQFPFHVEHIIANVHRLDDSLDNLAWACPRCNAYKGTNLATFDPSTGDQQNVFHPRKEQWSDHFAIEQGRIMGLSATGRATVNLLRMNSEGRVLLRRIGGR